MMAESTNLKLSDDCFLSLISEQTTMKQFYPKFSWISSAFLTVLGTEEPITCVHRTQNDLHTSGIH